MKRMVQYPRRSRVPLTVEVRRPSTGVQPRPTTVQRGRQPRPFDLAGQSEIITALMDALAALEADDGPLVAVIVPVLRRPHRVAPLVESFRAATAPGDARIYFVAQASDVAEVEAIRAVGLEPLLVGDDDQSWARKINRGYERTSEPWLLLGADDLRFHAGWIDNVRSQLGTCPGVIGTNDGSPATANGTRSTHPLVRRLYARICGTMDCRDEIVHEGYHHNFPDTELVMTARCRGLYAHCPSCLVEHLHPLWGKAAHDEVYTLGMSRWNADQALFYHRVNQFGIQ